MKKALPFSHFFCLKGYREKKRKISAGCARGKVVFAAGNIYAINHFSRGVGWMQVGAEGDGSNKYFSCNLSGLSCNRV